MSAETLIHRLSEYDFQQVSAGGYRGVVRSEISNRSGLVEWIDRSATKINDRAGNRGNRFLCDEAPDGRRWFIKQYHRGGLLAGSNDVQYESPVRFLKELHASVRANQISVHVPEPVGVFWKREGQTCTGYYISNCVRGQRVTRCFRDGDRPELMHEIGRILGRLHNAGIDHQDFKLDNLMRTEEGTIYVHDFEPAEIGTLSSWTRQLRLHRFLRFLEKHGFRNCGEETFLNGYRTETESTGSTYFHVQRPFLWIKNRLSDAMHQCFGQPLRPVDLEKILIRAPNWLGDSVMSLPMIESLSDRLPNSTIDVACRDSVAAVYRACPAVNSVWTVNEKTTKLPEEIAKQRYALHLILPKSTRTAIQAWRTGIPRRRGFAAQGRSLFLTDRVPLNNAHRTMHHGKMYYCLLEECWNGIPDPLPDVSLDGLKEWQDEVPSEWFSSPYLTVHPGSAYGPAKRWPPEKFNQLLHQIIESMDLTLLALGVEAEQDIAKSVLDSLPDERVINLVGDTSLEQCMVLLKRSRATIANDSGLMHLSAALETPVVSIFGSSSPDLTAPLGDGHSILYKNVECSPCFEQECPLTNDRYRCLERIDPEDVFDELQTLLSS